MCPTGGVLYAENIHIEAQSSQRGGSGSTGKASAYHDDINLALVGRVHQFLAGLIISPFLRKRTFGYFGI
jgi:hypothetical protein